MEYHRCTTVAGQVGSSSATANYLDLPIGIWIDSSNIMYVADASHHRVQRFILGNSTGTTVAGNQNGVAGLNCKSSQLH